MKNFVFLSPNFPTNYWKFCKELKENGMRVWALAMNRMSSWMRM